jgi:hypothetical protein
MKSLRTTVAFDPSSAFNTKIPFGQLPVSLRRAINDGLLRMDTLVPKLSAASLRATDVLRANGSGHAQAEALKPEVEALLEQANIFVGPLRDGLAQKFGPLNTKPDERLEVCWEFIGATASLQTLYDALWPTPQ